MTFVFNILTSVMCFLCAIGVGYALRISSMNKSMQYSMQGANTLCAVLEFVGVATIPTIYNELLGISFAQFTRSDGLVYWDSSFLSMCFNILAMCIVHFHWLDDRDFSSGYMK